jgi:succinylglutamate desuccinylase
MGFVNKRIIGTYESQRQGALIIAIGAMHGNEAAGVLALREVFSMLEKEKVSNSDFVFHGKLIGLIGNLKAYQTNQRFVENDLNRLWKSDFIANLQENTANLQNEAAELIELLSVITSEIKASNATQIVLLDLHTTSAEGGIFTIPTEDEDGLRLAKALFAPVILGLMHGIGGTLLHLTTAQYFQKFTSVPVTCVAFEGGQHEDALSVSRSISAVINCLRANACLRAEDVDNKHDVILKKHAAQLPKMSRLVYVHTIQPNDDFVMRPGYVNFQAIKKGEHLADDKNGAIYSFYNGLILMPLYQKKGSDGFFVVQEIF